jgi:iron(III) transport system ATP-binding protein
VGAIDFYGHDARVALTLPDGTAVTARLDGSDLPATGARVAVTVRGSALAFPATAGTAQPAAVSA